MAKVPKINVSPVISDIRAPGHHAVRAAAAPPQTARITPPPEPMIDAAAAQDFLEPSVADTIRRPLPQSSRRIIRPSYFISVALVALLITGGAVAAVRYTIAKQDNARP